MAEGAAETKLVEPAQVYPMHRDVREMGDPGRGAFPSGLVGLQIQLGESAEGLRRSLGGRLSPERLDLYAKRSLANLPEKRGDPFRIGVASERLLGRFLRLRDVFPGIAVSR